MKKSATLLSAVILLVGLLLALKFIPSSNKKQNKETAQAASFSATVITFTSDQLSSIAITDGDKHLCYLAPTDTSTSWQIQDYTTLKVDRDGLNYRLKKLMNVTSSRPVKSSDLKAFGLLKPNKTITYTLKDQTTHKLYIGSYAIDGTSLYVMPENSPYVYLIDGTYDNCMSTDLTTLCDMTLSDFNPYDFIIEDMSFSGIGFSPLSIVLDEEQNNLYASYHFTMDGYKALSLSHNTLEKIKTALPDLSSIQHFVASNVSDLSPYGLDAPVFHMCIHYKVKSSDNKKASYLTETLDLSFGTPLADGTTPFIIGEDTKNVYAMDASFITDLQKLFTPFTLADKYIAMPMITSVKKIDLSFTASQSAYHLTLDSAQSTYACNGVPIEETAFKKLYSDIISISADKSLENEDITFSKTPAVTICYTMLDDSIAEYNYVPSNDNQYYEIALQNVLPAECSQKQFSNLQKSLDAAINDHSN